MKYYATQLGSDPEGNPTILRQIEVGIPLTNYYEMRCVCDTDGTMYYSYGAFIGKITSTGVVTPPININTALTLTGYEVLGLSLDNGLEVGGRNLYIAINASYNSTSFKMYKINTSDFTLSEDNLHLINSAMGGMGMFKIDKINNLWLSKNLVSSTSNNFVVVNADDKSTDFVIYDGNSRTTFTAINQNGTVFGLLGVVPSTSFRRLYYNGSVVTGDSPDLNESVGYIIDSFCDKDGNLWGLSNKQDGTTQNKIYKITDLEGTPTVSSTINLTKEDLTTPLYYCYNLHTNSTGDIFFSTYSVGDGYNTYKIAVGTTTITKYITGLGSKTTGNDPYGFFVSSLGHTGYPIT